MTPLSFRGRLTLTMAGLVVLIAAATGIYLPRALANEAIALVGHKAETVAELTAFTIHPALYFGDRAALEEALSGTLGDADVAYVVVAAPDGRILLAHRRELASRGALARREPGGALAPGGSLYEVMTPVGDGERVLANLYVGLSLARMEKEVARMRAAIAVIAAMILAAALPLAFFLSGRLTNPLRDVAAGARRIASGDLDHRVPAHRDDEI
ncbi:MAG TPA: HAMP domain-containing protein, partial [Thermoanaerobaculia bacterium]